MAKPIKPGKTLNLPLFVELPVLTPEQMTDTTGLPVLTEALENEPHAPLTEAQSQQVAARLGPLLEEALRKKLATYVGGKWPEVWSELQAELPSMIRKELTKPASKK